MLVKRRSLISSSSILLGGLALTKTNHLLSNDISGGNMPSIGYAPWPEEGYCQSINPSATQHSGDAVVRLDSPVRCQIEVLTTDRNAAFFPNQITVTQKFRPLDCRPVDVTVWAYDRNPVECVSTRSNMRTLLPRSGLEFGVHCTRRHSELGQASFTFELQPNSQCTDSVHGLCEGVYLIPLASPTLQEFPWTGINLSSIANQLIVSANASQPDPTTYSFIAIGIRADDSTSKGA